MRARKLLVPAVVVIATALLISNLLLLRENRELDRALTVRFAALQVNTGSVVPPLRGKNVAGDMVSYPYQADRDRLLLVFAPECGFCDQNWPKWQALVKGLDSPKLEVLLVQLSGPPGDTIARAHGLGRIPLIWRVDPALYEPYQFRFVPQTILVGASGEVMKVWSGVLPPDAGQYLLSRYE